MWPRTATVDRSQKNSSATLPGYCWCMRLALTDNGRRWHHDRSDSIFSSQCKTDACRPPITFPRHLNLRIIGELDRGRLLLAIQPPWFDDVQLGMPDDKSNLLPSFCIQYVSNQSNSSVRLYSVVKLVQRQKSSAVAETARRFLSLNIAKSLKIIRNDTVEQGVCKSLL